MSQNKEYVAKRDAMIPLAEKEAWQKVADLGRETKRVKGVDGQAYEWSYFTEFFHSAMKRLCAGL